MKRLLIFFGFINSLAFSANSQSPKLFSPKEVKDDLVYLRSTLEASNYNLYAYTNKDVFDSLYKKIYLTIKDSLSSLQVSRLFQPYVALAKMGHCLIEFPFNQYYAWDGNSEYGKYIKQGGTVFPLNLCFSQNNVFVKENFSNDPKIKVGDEVMSLNGKPIKEVMKDIYNFVSGESEYHKNSVIENVTFMRIFWTVYDKCDFFDLKIKQKSGREIKLHVPAIPGNEFEERITQKKSVDNLYRNFRFINDIAFLHPGGFINARGSHNMMDQETFDNTEFRHFIDSAFLAFHNKKAMNLIIDLRNNPGGDNSFSDYMIAYFASEPFCFCSKFSIKTSQITKDFWKNVNISSLQGVKKDILSHENGACFDVVQPENQPRIDSMRFNGKVYVLINRYSYSNTTSTAAIIQDYKFGKIIGEETPDLPTAYGATHLFKLPNTQLTVQYPKAFTIRPSGDISRTGVIPNYQVMDDTSDGKDEILEYTIKLIDQKK